MTNAYSDVIYVWAMFYGRESPADPWMATGLEWRTASPPPTENFARTPLVTWDAYEFAPQEEMKVVGKLTPDDKPDRSSYSGA